MKNDEGNEEKFSGLNTSIPGISGALGEFRDTMKQFKGTDFSKNLGLGISQLLGATGAIKELQERMRQYNGMDFSKNLGLGISQLLGAAGAIKELQEQMRQFNDIDISKVKINENGTINYLDQTIIMGDTIVEINSCINSNISWEEKIVKILQGVKSKHKAIVFLIIMLLIAPIYEYYIDCAKGAISTTIQEIQGKSKMDNDKNKIIKDIKKEVYFNSSQDTNVKMVLGEYRFVKADCLNIRISNSINSRSIYTLKFGQVVRILNNNKNWTFIEYTDDESVYVKGWVFTRYINKFD